MSAPLDHEFRAAVRTGTDTDEVRLARALIDVGAVDACPDNVVLALSAAARLKGLRIFPGTVRRSYNMGGITRNYVDQAIAICRTEIEQHNDIDLRDTVSTDIAGNPDGEFDGEW